MQYWGMARIRSIHPNFAHSPSMRRVSRDARLLFVQLWTIVDDAGRTPAEPDDVAAVLYPGDFDAPRYMQLWLDELEAEGCIERYDVDGIDYLRVIHWHKHQQISHPTQSRLPPSPNEWPRDSGIPETSGIRRRRTRKTQEYPSLADRSCTFPENAEEKMEDDGPIVVTQETVLRDLRRIQRNAEADASHPSALRSVELIARIGGVSPSSERSKGRDMDEGRSPSPAELLGLPATRRPDDAS
jgi:hypothetical protein